MTTEIVHGSTTAYIAKGCRCDACKSAWSSYQRERRVRIKAEVESGLRPHGTRMGYWSGCRCEACKRAKLLRAKASRKSVSTEGAGDA